MELEHPHWADISLSAFASNVAIAKRDFAGSAKLMVAVKSNAYGHGQEILAPLALKSGADELAVLDIPTGLQLRRLLPDAPMLSWLLAASSDYRAAIEAGLDLGISHSWQLDALEHAGTSRPARIHLKIDTGLHRNGCLPQKWEELCSRAATLEQTGVVQVVAIWSHLADTSVEEDRASLARFHDAVELARGAGLSPQTLHIAASAAGADLPEARLDMVRIGLLAYGVSPFDDRRVEDFGLRPVMSVKARVVRREDDYAILGMGWGHGLLPLPADTGFVSIQGSACPILDVGAEETTVRSSAEVGEVAVMFGSPSSGSPRAEDWAQWAHTIGDEVITALPASLPRIYREDD